MGGAYYNEIDPGAVAWLRELIRRELIAPGDVDTRSIVDVRATELVGYTQCHFFAGIGVWSLALRAAGWPDGRPVWTGSCPCQPFSNAGRGLAFEDDRHLYPHWGRLIRESRPGVVFGEQTAGPLGLDWLDAVFADLEDAGYATAAADLCAAGVGAPHQRPRFYWLADTPRVGLQGGRGHDLPAAAEHRRAGAADSGCACGLEHPDVPGPQGCGSELPRRRRQQLAAQPGGGAGAAPRYPLGTGHTFWQRCEWILCQPEPPDYPDGRWRPIEPGTFPLAVGAAARVGRLRAYGNAIVPQVAEAFIRTYLDLCGEQ